MVLLCSPSPRALLSDGIRFVCGTPEFRSLTTLGIISRLYSKGRVLGHKRAKRNTRPNTSLLQIEGVGSKEEAQFYLGKVIRPFMHHVYGFLISFALSACGVRLQSQEGATRIKGPSHLGVRVSPCTFCTFSHLVTNEHFFLVVSLAPMGTLVL